MPEHIVTDNITKRVVPGVGPRDAKVAIVGEAPGAQEAKEGLPFVGPSGKVLMDCMKGVGLVRSMCYITNVVKEKPYKNNIKPYIDLSKKVPTVSERGQAYIDSLKEELENIAPNVVVAVGAVPLWVLCGEKGITNWRGSILESTLIPGLKVIPVIHPASALRNYLFRHFIAFDFKKIVREASSPEMPEDNREYILEPTYKETMDFLAECMAQKQVGFDIEVSYGQVSCISFAYRAETHERAISIPFFYQGREYFPVNQEAVVIQEIARILENPDIEVVAHNAAFDTTFLFRRYGIRANNIQDTMIAQAILFPDFPKGLGFVTSIYTDIPYYKDEGKAGIGAGGVPTRLDKQFWLYNAKDSIVLIEAMPKMLEELQRTNNLETYEHQRRLLQPLLYMTERGIRMDSQGLIHQAGEAATELKKIEERAYEIIGRKINLGSPKQLKEYFYEERGQKPYVHQGKPTTNEKAIKRLIRNPDPKISEVAKLLQEHRKLSKMKGTYYEMKLDEDKRLRCSMNPVGTRTGRLSSSKTIFGTGANLQNQPYKMKKFMLPDEGYVMYNVDLGQAENRIVALISGDSNMLSAFVEGRDIHRQTAGLLFGKPYDEISNEKGSSDLGSGDRSERDWGKEANHALNYNMGYRTAALRWEIPENEAKMIVEKYHQAYPGVRRWHSTVEQTLRRTRTLENLYGRRYTFWDRWDNYLLLAAYAFMPQSTVADKINREGVCEIYYDQELYHGVEFMLQVHDSVVFQIPLYHGWEYHARVLRALKESLEQPLHYHDRELVIPAEFEMLPFNLLDGWEVSDDLFLEEEMLAKALELNYERMRDEQANT